MKNIGQKMPLLRGEDGKLYFNFAKGLKVLMHGSDRESNEEYTIEVIGCHYFGNTEYYDVARDGMQLPQPLSANRVKYLVSRYGVKTIAYGERQELPLLLEEVKLFYEVQERARENVRTQACKISEYVALNVAARALNSKIGYVQAFGHDDEAAALGIQQAELQRRAASVLIEHGIEPNLLAEPPKCVRCGGKGYVANAICDCAIARSDEIKRFNIEHRREKQYNYRNGW